MSSFDIYSGRVRVRSCALIEKDDKILLIKQSVPTKNHPVWIPPGGGVQMGETSEQALIREVFEETGLNAVPSRLRYVHEFIQESFHSIELYYICEVEPGTLKKGTDPEHAPDNQLILDVAWKSISRLSEIELFPEFLRKDAADNTVFSQGISHFKTA